MKHHLGGTIMAEFEDGFLKLSEQRWVDGPGPSMKMVSVVVEISLSTEQWAALNDHLKHLEGQIHNFTHSKQEGG